MKCTYRVERLLKENQKLKVHSVYRHTVNVIIDGHILAFHPDTIPSTPLSVALPFSEKEFRCFEEEAQRTGSVNLYPSSMYLSQMDGQSFFSAELQKVKVKDFHMPEMLSSKSSNRCYWICTGNFIKNAGKIILWEDRLDKSEGTDESEKWEKSKKSQKSQSILEKALCTLLPVLTQNYQLGGFSDCAVTSEKREEDSFITQILREKTADILSKNRLEEYEAEYEQLICSLIGLGPGLTPSGDDFLTGILLAFSLQENIREDNENKITKKETDQIEKKKKQICKVVSKHLDRTNDISREYLVCAMENRFGELYHILQEELVHGNVQKDIFCRIIHTGHSSGLDTLNGLAVGLKITGCQK